MGFRLGTASAKRESAETYRGYNKKMYPTPNNRSDEIFPVPRGYVPDALTVDAVLAFGTGG